MSSSSPASTTVWITPEDVAEARISQPVQFGPLGEKMFLRTYARDLPDGTKEDWHQTMARVVNGNFNFVADHHVSRQEALDLYRLLLTHQIVPGGRHLWATGVQMGNSAINNCHGADHTVRFSEHFEHTFLRLMEGGGVGSNVSDKFINSRGGGPTTPGKPWRVRAHHEIHIICNPNHKDYERYVQLENEYDILCRGVASAYVFRDAAGQFNLLRQDFLDETVFPFTGLLSQEYSYRSTPTENPNVRFLQVKDSREGWAEVLIEVLDAYTNDRHPKKFVIDVSQIRAFGEPIRTFGGTASGPEAFMLLLRRIEALMAERAGSDLGWHDIALIEHWIALAVISGGARRSARMLMKYWGDPGIFEFINMKRPLPSGHTPHGTTNISVVLDNKFFRRYKAGDEHAVQVAEALTLGMLRNGEPGVVNASKFLEGEAPGTTFYVTNPCVPEYVWIETTEGPRQVKDLIGRQFTAVVQDRSAKSTEDGFFFTGVKPIVRLHTTDATVDLTEDHLVLTPSGEFVEAGKLRPGDQVQQNTWYVPSSPIPNNPMMEALGWLYGDGCLPSSDRSACFDFWGRDREYGEGLIKQVFPEATVSRNDALNRIRLTVRNVDRFTAGVLVGRGVDKSLDPQFEKLPLDQAISFLRGWFAADGSVQGTAEKGVSLRLSSINEASLLAAQRVLQRVGIKSKVYLNRRPAGIQQMPNGKGELAAYNCKATHELIVSRASLNRFAEYIGLPGWKGDALQEVIDRRKKRAYSDRPYATVLAIEPTGESLPVYDCTIPDGHVFSANGIVVHNCGEIGFVKYEDMYSFDVCCIGHLNLAMLEEPELASRLLARFLLRASCAPITDPRMKANVERNHRLGGGLLGYADWLILNGIKYSESYKHPGVTTFLRELREMLVKNAKDYAHELRVVSPIKYTTIAPTGTVSMLSGVTSGLQPVFAKFFIRRVRFSEGKDPEQLEALRTQGYHIEADAQTANTSVVEFVTRSALFDRALLEFRERYPEDNPEQIEARVVEVFEDEADLTYKDVLNVQKMLQSVWADNAISVTTNLSQDLDPEELTKDLMHRAKKLKGLTLFPEFSFPQAPLERISWEKFRELQAAGYPIDVSQDEQSCKNGVCPIK